MVFRSQAGLNNMFRLHWKTLCITASMLLSPCVAPAVESDLGLHRHIATASILRSAQEPTTGSSVLNPSMSTQRFLRQVSLQRGVFLIAKRHIKDPRFNQTVILIIGHDSWGSIGLVVNRPSEVPVTKLLPEWAELVDADAQVYYGGPVEINLVRFLIRSPRPLDIGRRVLEDVYMVASKPVLDALINNKYPNNVIHTYIGYAGWGVGQLEHEVDRGDWYIIKGDAKTLFDSDPETLWKQFIRALSGSWVYHRHDPAWLCCATGLAPNGGGSGR
jgi:putative transcriptional regulator